MNASAKEQTMTISAPLHPAAYIRAADADSANDVRVQRQRAAVLCAARERGWPEPAVYTDIGPSGWQRPSSDLTRLTADISGGQRDAVITADLYRISRTPADTAGFAEHCVSHDVTIEPIDDADGPDPRAAAISECHRQQQLAAGRTIRRRPARLGK
jgi:DNA invertase Pin-like site-specific DNA recombinase